MVTSNKHLMMPSENIFSQAFHGDLQSKKDFKMFLTPQILSTANDKLGGLGHLGQASALVLLKEDGSREES